MKWITTNVEVERNWKQFFVGRTSELRSIRDALLDPSKKAVLVTGERGTGKTALLRLFADTDENCFPGGVTITNASPFMWNPEIGRPGANGGDQPLTPVRSNALWVVDDLTALVPAGMNHVTKVLASEPLLKGLFASTDSIALPFPSVVELRLGPLSLNEFQQLLQMRARAANIGDVERLWNQVQGNALMAAFAGKTIRDGLLTWETLLQSIQNFDRPGILGPDGQPALTNSASSRQIIAEVTEVNEHLLNLAKSDPDVLYSLGPRKFEEFIAELLMRRGYQVELTPASKDGGFDMYAAKKETLGEFLFLVECKKYARYRRVGVEVVRALHGVVQQKRATAGIVVTTSFFSRGANDFRSEVAHQMHLADYIELQKWLRVV